MVGEDELLYQVLSYLTNKGYPEDASEGKKRIIRKKAFFENKGELFTDKLQ